MRNYENMDCLGGDLTESSSQAPFFSQVNEQPNSPGTSGALECHKTSWARCLTPTEHNLGVVSYDRTLSETMDRFG